MSWPHLLMGGAFDTLVNGYLRPYNSTPANKF